MLENIPLPVIEHGIDAIRVLLILAIGIPLLRFVVNRIAQAITKHGAPQTAFFIRSVLYYGGLAILVAIVLNQLGFKLGALLGAAGVAGIAIGFAAQTTLSNLISGLFIIGERPFSVGDIIVIGTTRGVVETIDLLSVKLRTFDNLLIRIPSESLLKQEVTNVTRYPIRRFEITVGVAYKEDLGRVIAVLQEVVRDNPYALDEPEPLIQFVKFGESSLDVFLGVWVARENWINLRGSLMPEIKARFDAENIEIPFPHRTLYTGSVTDPMPIAIQNRKNGYDGYDG